MRCSRASSIADAAIEYEHTAYDYPRNARSAEAGYAALVAYQKYEDAHAARGARRRASARDRTRR